MLCAVCLARAACDDYIALAEHNNYSYHRTAVAKRKK